MRLIDADALVEKFTESMPEYLSGTHAQREAIKLINDMPTIEPVKRGKWTIAEESTNCRLVVCSACERTFAVNINIPHEEWANRKPYCDQCGAYMKAEPRSSKK